MEKILSNYFPEKSNFQKILSPYKTLRNISMYKSFKKENIEIKKNLLDSKGNIIYNPKKNYNKISHSETNNSGITMLDDLKKIIQKNNIKLLEIPIKNKKYKFLNTTYTYLLKKNRKNLNKFNLQKYEKPFSKSIENLYLKNDLRNYSLPKIYSYQIKGTPRYIQDVYIKYSNEKRNLKLKILKQENFDDLKHKVVTYRRFLYNPKNI
jgi:hypothetical protein